MRHILAICFLLTLITSVKAQNTGKSIQFLNSDSKRPVVDVLITFAGSTNIMTPDMNGIITFSGSIEPFTVSGLGFTTILIDPDTLHYSNGRAIVLVQPKIMTLSEIKIISTSQNSVFKPISELDIRLRPINNSQEVLRMVPGLFIGQHAGGGKAEQIFLRGFDVDHGTDVQISVDGIPVNMVSHAHGQGYADLHFVIPELIHRVEFDKGPYSASHGNFSSAGYVDFKTKDVLDKNFVQLEAGRFDTYRAVFGINLLKPKRINHSLLLAGEGSFTQGYFDSPQDFYRFNGMLKYLNKLNENNEMSLTVTAFSSEWNASGQIPERAVKQGIIGFYGAIDDTEGGYTTRLNGNFKLHSQLGNGASWDNQIYYTSYEFDLFSNFTFYKEDPRNGDQINQYEFRRLAGYNGTYKKSLNLGKIEGSTTIGLQLRYDDIPELALYHTKDRLYQLGTINQGSVQETNGGLWARQILRFPSGLQTELGLRFDYFNNTYEDSWKDFQKFHSSSSILSPKIKLSYPVNERWQLYWYGGKSFHSNDTRIVALDAGRKVVTPAWGSDLGTIVKPGERWLLQAALWYLYMEQEFVYIGDEGIVEPSGRTQRLGADFSIRYQLGQNFFFDTDLNIARPRSLDEGKGEDYIPLAPVFTAAGGFSYKTIQGWNGSLRYRWMGDRPANEDYSTTAKGYFILDGSLFYTARRWEIGVNFQNLLNSKWKETQFDTESRLKDEAEPVTEIHFTPGIPFYAGLHASWFF